MKRLLFVGLLFVAGACSSKPAAPSETRVDDLEMTFAGCASVLAGRVCEVAPSGATLTFAVPGGEGDVDARVGTEALPAVVTKTPTGRRVQVNLAGAPDGQKRRVDVCVVLPGKRRCYNLNTTHVARDARLVEASKLRASNNLDGALSLAQALDSAETPEPTRARAASLAARILLSRGETVAAVSALEAALAAHLAAGRMSDAALDAFALSHTLVTRLHKFSRALLVLAKVDGALEVWDQGAAQVDYYRALALRESGRPRDAIFALEKSTRLTLELGLWSQYRDNREVLARLFQSLGRHAEAIQTFQELVSSLKPEDGPCVRAHLMGAQTWSELGALLSFALPTPTEGLGERLTMARRLYTEDCPRPDEADAATINLALYSVLTGDIQRAETLVHSLDGASRKRGELVEVWRLDLAGRIALGRNSPKEALSVYDLFAAKARAAVAPAPLLRALVGKGKSLVLLGRKDAAIKVYSEVEDLLDAEMGRLPAGEERALFLDEQAASLDALVELLVETGHIDAALSAARRGRSRNIQSAIRTERVAVLTPALRAQFEADLARYRSARAALAADEEQAWTRPKEATDEADPARQALSQAAREALDSAFAVAGEAPLSTLSPRRPERGEILLLLHSHLDGRTRVFAKTTFSSRTFLVTVKPDAPLSVLSTALLGPLADLLNKVDRVRVLASGLWQGVDIHALPTDEPLVARAEVVYSLDLPPREDETPGKRGISLIVSNPEGDLAGADKEADGAVEKLKSGGGTVRLSGEKATKQALLVGLDGAFWFHFGGHGVYAPGWEAGLRLAEGIPFTVRDALGLELAPTHVVLSGCETARSAKTRALDIGLAEAFIVRGAEDVVAATRPVADSASADLMAAMYLRAAETNLARALTLAQRGALSGAKGTDWAAYRAIVR